MRLFDSKNHRTKDGKRFAEQLSHEPITKLCTRYLEHGARIADMMHIVNVDLNYAMSLANLRQHAFSKPRKSKRT